jgi:hypothetical protein
MTQFRKPEIGEYIRHIEEKDAKIYHMIEQRCRELYKEIFATIETNKQKEIIPIYEPIEKARLPWLRISEILKSIVEDKYQNRFIIRYMPYCRLERHFINQIKGNRITS